MPSQIGKLKYILLFTLLIVCGGIVGYGLLYQIPQRKCEASGGWFSFRYRSCSTPLYLPTLTGRKPGAPEKMDFHEESGKASRVSATGGASSQAAKK